MPLADLVKIEMIPSEWRDVDKSSAGYFARLEHLVGLEILLEKELTGNECLTLEIYVYLETAFHISEFMFDIEAIREKLGSSFHTGT